MLLADCVSVGLDVGIYIERLFCAGGDRRKGDNPVGLDGSYDDQQRIDRARWRSG